MKSASQIILNPVYKTQKNSWLAFFKDKPADAQFTSLLWPIFSYVDYELSNCKSSFLDSNTRRNIVTGHLISRLTPMISRVCCMEMHSLRDRKFLNGKSSEERFKNYVQLIQEPNNAADLLQKYQLLDQAIIVTIHHYIEFFKEFFAHSKKDYIDLVNIFMDKDKSYVINELKISGDTHNKGRTVIIAKWHNNEGRTKKIVYKPRSLAIDLAFNELLRWINPRISKSHFLISYLSKDNYGWCEYVDYKKCHSDNEISSFYHRTGSLLAILYLLTGSDVHLENFIAHGGYPVIVDLECLMRPFFETDNKSRLSIQRPLVTESYILPFRILIQKNHMGVEISALLGKGGQSSPYLRIDWELIGTDQMHAKRIESVMLKSHNLPFLDSHEVNPLDHEQDFIAGFNESYDVIVTNKSFLLSEKSPLMSFRNTTIRTVLRSTGDYTKLLYESFHPELWYFQDKREEHFAWLKQSKPDHSFYATLYPSEYADLKTGNVPAFYCKTTENFLYDSNGNKVSLVIAKNGFDCVREHICHNFSNNDKYLQVELIKMCFQADKMNEFGIKKHKDSPVADTEIVVKNNTDQLQLKIKQAIIHILKKIRILAIQEKQGCFWPTLTLQHNLVWTLDFTDINLYDGLAGIILIFGYAGKILRDANDINMSAEALKNLIDIIFRLSDEELQAYGCGAYTGLSGVIYCLNKVKEIHADIDAQPSIQRLNRILQSSIGSDQSYDIIGGIAGCMAAMSAAPNKLKTAKREEILTNCCDHLFQHYPIPEQLPTTNVVTKNSKPLVGFSHGVTGIAWALANFAPRSHHVRAKKWVEQTYLYEQSLFSAEQKNWPGLNDEIGQSIYPFKWCYGAPGMALAKMSIPNEWRDKQTANELSTAIKTTMQHGHSNKYNLCHGAVGNLDILWEYYLRSGDEGVKSYVFSRTHTIISHILDDDYETDLAKGITLPGLMTGELGIVYFLLRLLEPKVVPNLLLLS